MAFLVWGVICENSPEVLSPLHLMMALHWLRCAPTFDSGASRFGVDPKTFHKYVWLIVDLLDLHLQNIRFDDRHEVDHGWNEQVGE